MSEPLPDLLSRIADAAGEEAARLVAKEWGGRIFYLPKEFRPTHRLVEIVGEKKARAIWQEIGSGAIQVPMGEAAGPAARRRAVAELLEREVSHSEAAKTVGVHTRTVERVARRKRDRRQGDLF